MTNPGGMVQTVVHKDEDGIYWMDLIGNATYLNKVSISLEDILTHKLDNHTQIPLNENENYHKFLKELTID